MSDESRFSFLFHKYVSGSADEAERLEFMRLVDIEGMQQQLNTLVDAEMRTTYVAESLREEERTEILRNIYSVSMEQPAINAIDENALFTGSARHDGKATITRTAGNDGKAEDDGNPLRRSSSGFVLSKRIAVAAAVAFMAICIYFFNDHHVILNLFQDPGSARYANDIAPGKNSATLTLANGKIINLSDEQTGVVIDASSLKYSDGSVISDANPSSRTEGRDLSDDKDPSILRDDGQVNTLAVSTPRGGTYQVVLPDGTRVWLNAGSALKFPARFSGTERVVELTGEAYFEVATAYTTSAGSSSSTATSPSLRGRRTKQSFKVVSGNQELTVLGTHFNVNAYGDEGGVRTTLLEGSIKIASQAHNDQSGTNAVILKPGQQSILASNKQTLNKQTVDKQIKILEVDTEEAIAWKNGYFSFSDDKIQDIMQTISRWYDIEVSYEGNITTDGFNGKISRNKNISQVLKMLEDTKLVHFNVKGRRVIVRE